MEKVITAAFSQTTPEQCVDIPVTTVKSRQCKQQKEGKKKSQMWLLAKINDTKGEDLYEFGCKIAISKCLLLLY